MLLVSLYVFLNQDLFVFLLDKTSLFGLAPKRAIRLHEASLSKRTSLLQRIDTLASECLRFEVGNSVSRVPQLNLLAGRARCIGEVFAVCHAARRVQQRTTLPVAVAFLESI